MIRPPALAPARSAHFWSHARCSRLVLARWHAVSLEFPLTDSTDCPRAVSGQMEAALQKLDQAELGNLARLRAYLSRRHGAPEAPELGRAIGEVVLASQRKRLPPHQQAHLAYAAARLSWQETTLLYGLATECLSRGARQEAITLLNAFARLGASKAFTVSSGDLFVLPLFELALTERGLEPAALAAILRCADLLQVELPQATLDASAQQLLSHKLGRQGPPQRYGEALAALCRRGAALEQ
ncbi:unnamed protein product, partial [Polarella glacialis]